MFYYLIFHITFFKSIRKQNIFKNFISHKYLNTRLLKMSFFKKYKRKSRITIKKTNKLGTKYVTTIFQKIFLTQVCHNQGQTY